MNARPTLLAAIALLGTVAAGQAQAGWLSNLTAAAAVTPDCGTPVPACAQPAPDCCAPRITYNHVCVHRVCCCGCNPPIETVLSVKDPSCCSAGAVAIPVCLPACCSGAPTVSCHSGLFGRGVVRNDYCCGLSIKIVFRLNGDIAVTYIGA